MNDNRISYERGREFVRLVEEATGEECRPEFCFNPPRRWRFDFAIPNRRVAVEVEGGVWAYGRHNRAAGFLKDMEKYNAAAARGWRLLRCTPAMLLESDFLFAVAAACCQAHPYDEGEAKRDAVAQIIMRLGPLGRKIKGTND